MVQTSRQTEIKLLEREFQRCSSPFYFSVPHLTNGFIHKSKFLISSTTLRGKKKSSVVVFVNRVLPCKALD